jgi:hypothetical protein
VPGRTGPASPHLSRLTTSKRTGSSTFAAPETIPARCPPSEARHDGHAAPVVRRIRPRYCSTPPLGTTSLSQATFGNELDTKSGTPYDPPTTECKRGVTNGRSGNAARCWEEPRSTRFNAWSRRGHEPHTSQGVSFVTREAPVGTRESGSATSATRKASHRAVEEKARSPVDGDAIDSPIHVRPRARAETPTPGARRHGDEAPRRRKPETTKA